MKKLLVGTAVGLAVGCVLYKLHREGKLDCMCDDMGRFASKAKKNFRNVMDMGKNEAEYIKDRVEYEYENGKEKLNDMQS